MSNHTVYLRLLSLQDIKWALARGYPSKLRYKLYERQGNSLRASGRYTEALQAFRKALAVLEQAQLIPEIAQKFTERVQESLASCKGKSDRKQKSKTPEEESAGDHVTVTSDPDSLYPDLASSCEVRESPQKGLYVVAKETIKPGDVIIKERPYAWTVEPDYKHTYCHHCISRLVTVLSTNTTIVLGDDEAECWLVSSKILNFCLNYPIGQFSGFLLPRYPRQVLSIISEVEVSKQCHHEMFFEREFFLSDSPVPYPAWSVMWPCSAMRSVWFEPISTISTSVPV